MGVNDFGLAGGWKLCAKMRLSLFTHITFRARNWKPRKSKWMLGKSPRCGQSSAPSSIERVMQEEICQQGRDHSLNAKGNFRFERTIVNWLSAFVLDLRRKG